MDEKEASRPHHYCSLLRFRSSSPLGSNPASSSALSAVSVGFRMCAMLPRRVGGAEWSLTMRFLVSPRFAEFHDQLPKASTGGGGPPLDRCGSGGVAGRE